MEGGQAISKLLNECITINSLHLQDAGLDDDTLIEICQGIDESMSLEYLDLRHNIFHRKGLARLI